MLNYPKESLELHRDDGEDKELGSPAVDHVARQAAADAKLIAEKADLKVDGIKERLNVIDQDLREGFKDFRGSLTRVHERIDELKDDISALGTTISARINKLTLIALGAVIVFLAEIVASKIGLI